MPLERTRSTFGKPSKSKRVTSMPKFDGEAAQLYVNLKSDTDADFVLPQPLKSKLHDLFSQIEKEFETMYLDYLHLQNKVDILNDKLERETYEEKTYGDLAECDCATAGKSRSNLKQKSGLHGGSSQKLKTAHKLKAQTSKIVSSFKTPSITCSLVKEFSGHRDGVWDVDVPVTNQPLVGTASAGRYFSTSHNSKM